MCLKPFHKTVSHSNKISYNNTMAGVKRVNANVFVSGISNDLCNPFFDSNGNLFIIRQNAASILSVDTVGNSKTILTTGGQPSSATFSDDGILYIADFGHSGVLAVTKEGQQELIVGVYEDKQLKGPNGIFIADGDIFFTDSGAFGETGLHSPTGSLFAICGSPSGQILKPLSLSNLAYPAGIAVTKDKKFIYVAETMQNRVLRYFQQPQGVFHGSVFYQLNGGVGPVALSLDANENLFIGQYDVRDSSNEGNVYVVSPTGKLNKIIVTQGAEISGLAIWFDPLKQSTLYITEKSTGSILKVEV